MNIVLTYKGYDLVAIRGGYQSDINGHVLKFDTAGMWKDYIDTFKR